MNKKPSIAVVLSMEQYSHRIWQDVAKKLEDVCTLRWCHDFELLDSPEKARDIISTADALFASMIVFKDHADALKSFIDTEKTKSIIVVDSMPEAAALTKLGKFTQSGKGMPEGMKKIVRLLVKGRDEDSLYGYIKLQKIVRLALPFLPEKARDFKNWMSIYNYWTQPIGENIESMFRLLLKEYHQVPTEPKPAVVIPTMGVYHPKSSSYFKDAAHFIQWYKKEQKKQGKSIDGKKRIGIILMRKHLLQDNLYINQLIEAFESADMVPIPCFVMGVEAHVVVREWLQHEKIDVLINTIGFGLVGGPAGSTKPDASRHFAEEILSNLNVPYIVSQPLFVQQVGDWTRNGVGSMHSAVTFAIPELDGAIAPIVFGGLAKGRLITIPDRLKRLTGLVSKLADLRRKANHEKKLAFVVYDYPPGLGKKATAALLNVPRSLLSILNHLKEEGYDVGEIPATAEELFEMIDRTTSYETALSSRTAQGFTQKEYWQSVSTKEQQRITKRWGEFPGDIAPLRDGSVFIGGLRFGNIFIGVQPKLGVSGDPMRLLFDKANTPHHQYISFYRWISRSFKADALIHVGMHGSVEWLPGLQLGVNNRSWSDALLGEVPHFYLYPINNPSEANLAKRRGYATMISHIIPPLQRAGLYQELHTIKELISDFREGRATTLEMEELVLPKAEAMNLYDDCPRLSQEPIGDYILRLSTYLTELESRLISASLHTFGESIPVESQKITILEWLKATDDAKGIFSFILSSYTQPHSFSSYPALCQSARQGQQVADELRTAIERVCEHWVDDILATPNPSIHHAETVLKSLMRQSTLPVNARGIVEGTLTSVLKMRSLLGDQSHELKALIRGLRGEYLPSGAGGDIIRDGFGVLPTGRNIHAMDPWRIPSEVAFRRGTKIADELIAKHLAETGSYPESIATVFWGLDTIKTRGEAIAIAVRLMGAEPAYDGQGKISHFALTPLATLGRPRIDVVMQLSPVFRDTFSVVMDHLDKLVRLAAKAEEPLEMNFIRKHSEAAMQSGATFESATARLFTQSQGQYGTYVDDMIEDSAWQSEEDLDHTFIRRNAFTYGGKRGGKAESQILDGLMKTVTRVVHQVDSVEFGISDIDHYFSTSGSLQLAAKRRGNSSTKLNYVESFTAETKIMDVKEALRVEYRTKFLNPKWFEGMIKQGRSGATEISNRMTYMLGWDAVTESVDDWVYTKTAETYALNPEIREKLEALNPEAMKNIVGRLLEASGRGMWKADEDLLDKLRDIYADLEDRLEGIKV
ncbi:MAG: magnesium chelatase subunit H [Chloroherpetonaceae bacterium]|nr:magnesium chelatase subunit H [Chloroherpetonaceae bacterium]